MKATFVILIILFAVGCSDSPTTPSLDTDAGWSLQEDTAGTDMVNDGADLVEADMALDLVFCGKEDERYTEPDLPLLIGCESLRGTLGLVDFYEEAVPEVKDLKHVQGGVVINRAPYLKSLDVFKNLVTVGQNLSFKSIPSSGDRLEMPYLRNVSGRITMTDLPTKTLNFPSLEVVGGLSIYAVEVESLDGFGRLRLIEGELNISDEMITVISFPSLEVVGGELGGLTVFAEIESLDGFGSLRMIKGDLKIQSGKLTQADLEAFLARVEVTGVVQFNGEIFTP